MICIICMYVLLYMYRYVCSQYTCTPCLSTHTLHYNKTAYNTHAHWIMYIAHPSLSSIWFGIA